MRDERFAGGGRGPVEQRLGLLPGEPQPFERLTDRFTTDAALKARLDPGHEALEGPARRGSVLRKFLRIPRWARFSAYFRRFWSRTTPSIWLHRPAGARYNRPTVLATWPCVDAFTNARSLGHP